MITGLWEGKNADIGESGGNSINSREGWSKNGDLIQPSTEKKHNFHSSLRVLIAIVKSCHRFPRPPPEFLFNPQPLITSLLFLPINTVYFRIYGWGWNGENCDSSGAPFYALFSLSPFTLWSPSSSSFVPFFQFSLLVKHTTLFHSLSVSPCYFPACSFSRHAENHKILRHSTKH